MTKRRGYLLKLQVFSVGFAIMCLELLVSRLVTPLYGNSIWTWGGIIGVVLTALAIGYWYGGKIADAASSIRSFAVLLFAAGILIIPVPLLVQVLPSGALFVWFGDKYAPSVATFLLAGPQTFVLGMATPFALRLDLKNLDSVGRVSGNLYSISTAGSIVGTFCTVFFLIPSLDVRPLLYGLGTALMLVALPFLPKRSIAPVAISFLLFLPYFTHSQPQWAATKYGGSVVFEKQTPYSTLDVVDFGTQRILFLNGYVHSGMDLRNSTRLVFQYTTYFNLGMRLNPNATRVLFVGGGGFSGPKYFLSAYHNVHVDVVEIDPDVIQAAQDFFSLRQDPRLTIYDEDARVFLSETDLKYDVVVLDAYSNTYVPFHLMTYEFFDLLKTHLSHEGVVISNLIGSMVGDDSRIVRAEVSTASMAFNNLAVFETELNSSAVQNIELVLAKSDSFPLNSSVARIEAHLAPMLEQASSEGLVPAGGYLEHLYAYPVRVNDVPVLTDGYAPVDSLLNPVTGHAYVLEQRFGRLVPTSQVLSIEGLGTVGVLSLGAPSIIFALRKSRPGEQPGNTSF